MCRRSFFPIFAIVLSTLSLASAWAKAPIAPTEFKVTPLGVNSFQIDWKDNSTDEVGFELRVGLKSDNPPPHFQMLQLAGTIPTTNKQGTIIMTNPLPGRELDFQLAAYKGTTGLELFSKPTPVITVKAFATTVFGAPTNLRAKRVDDSQIRIAWDDNATSEYGYLVYLKKGSGKWQLFTRAGPGTAFNFPFYGFAMNTTYSFRVRAFKENPAVFSNYSNVLTVTTKSEFQAPSDLVAFRAGDGKFRFKWKDNSSLETGIDLEAKMGTGPFTRALKVAGSDYTKTNAVGVFAPDTRYQFRLRVFRLVDGKEVFSKYSNVYSIKSAPMSAPTNFTGELTNNTSVLLKWKDNSPAETGYEVQYRKVGTTAFSSGNISQQESVTITNLESNVNYEFRIRATTYIFQKRSAFTSFVQVKTKDGILGNLNPTILTGESFRYPVLVSTPAKLTALTVTGLPAGLQYNASSRTITGKLATAGTYTVTLKATFNDGTSTTRSLVLKSDNEAPVASQSFAAVNVAAAATSKVSILGKFSDPDTTSVARVNTTLGSFDIILFPDATPSTVGNFLDYIDDVRYNDTFFHRAAPNFVVQGGGYKYTAANGFTRVPTFPAVVNEPGLSNVRGTVAMAKLGGLPNSATSQFFVNLSDNSSNLDAQNGGFTVFGRVPTSGMTLLDSINNLPKNTYTVTTNLGNETLDDVPMNAATAPAVMDPSKLVKITSVVGAPILTYQVLSLNTAVATASLSGTDITITGVAKGSTTVSVTATDLDGRTVSQNISVTVP